MLSKISFFSLLLALALLTVACSFEPSKTEFDKFVFNKLISEDQNGPDSHYSWKDKIVWHTINGYSANSYFTSLTYLMRTEIIKNDNEETVKSYPYIGIAYFVSINSFLTNDKNLFNKESVRQSIVNEMSKLNFNNNQYGGAIPIKVAGYLAHYGMHEYRWGKETKKWQ